MSSSSSSRYAYADISVDLSGQTDRNDLYLNFWARRYSSESLSIYLSGDGTTWQSVLSISLNTSYIGYSLDLDQLASSKNINLDIDVYIQFKYSGYSNDKIYLDDVSIITE